MTRQTYRARAYQLRSDYLASLLAAFGAWVRDKARAIRRRGAMAGPDEPFVGIEVKTAAVVAVYVIVLAVAVAGAAQAQQVSLRVDGWPAAGTDDDVLAAFGLSTQSIDQTNDTESLWRVVRDVVLPERVSAATGQAILRRLWQVDANLPAMDAMDIHNGPADPADSAAATAQARAGMR